jgi:hypothetical protein
MGKEGENSRFTTSGADSCLLNELGWAGASFLSVALWRFGF